MTQDKMPKKMMQIGNVFGFQGEGIDGAPGKDFMKMGI